ncbi:hypothetical protein EU527_03165 [Candidatus Thorarchaeota archaeon]|nr:MAG: hypothetical protein EU527_03165 [Candidatus Thorarchaeota archaeon]
MTNETKDMATVLAFIRTIDAEKRTHLAELRTGIGILTIPMALLTILITTSDYYTIETAFVFFLGLSIGIVILFFIGVYLVGRALKNIKRDDRLRRSLKDMSCLLDEYNNCK